MRNTKLILLEGLPGAGKSTAAQFLTRQMNAQGIPATWWYEEVRAHPLYTFHDADSLRQVVADLFSGNHQRVVAAVLAKWQAFADGLLASGGVAVLDGCLLGYLTWSLFPADVPLGEIGAYVSHVLEFIAPLNPTVIYLLQDDIAAALQRICDRRGGDTERRFIERATDNPYARRRGLTGYDGMVRYWSEFREFIDSLFAGLTVDKLMVQNTAGDWPAYEAAMLEILKLQHVPQPDAPEAELARLTGSYHRSGGSTAPRCGVQLEDGALTLNGVPRVWPHTRLLPEPNGAFAVSSLPIRVTFAPDTTGSRLRMHVLGPELLEGPVDFEFVRDE